MVRGSIGDPEGGGRSQVGVVGNERCRRRVQERPLGECPDGGGPENPLPGHKWRPRAGGQHLAGELAARCERHRDPDLVFAGDQQHVGKVDRGGVHPHQELAGSRDRVWKLADNQVLGRTVRTADDRAHQPAPFTTKAKREGPERDPRGRHTWHGRPHGARPAFRWAARRLRRRSSSAAAGPG